MQLRTFISEEKGGVKGAVWTIGLVVLIVFIVLALFIIAPDFVYAVIYRLADFVFCNYGI